VLQFKLAKSEKENEDTKTRISTIANHHSNLEQRHKDKLAVRSSSSLTASLLAGIVDDVDVDDDNDGWIGNACSI
jgi:hypothetical protein